MDDLRLYSTCSAESQPHLCISYSAALKYIYQCVNIVIYIDLNARQERDSLAAVAHYVKTEWKQSSNGKIASNDNWSDSTTSEDFMAIFL